MYLRKKTSGYTLLNALLGIILLAGIIYLIMHTMTKHSMLESERAIGENLAPIVDEAILTNIDNLVLNDTYPLVTSTNTSCHHSQSPFLSSISSSYLESLKNMGFDLAKSACISILG